MLFATNTIHWTCCITFSLCIAHNEYRYNKIHSLWHSLLIPASHRKERLLQPLWIYTDLAFPIRRHTVMHSAFREGQTLPCLLMEWELRRETHEPKALQAPSHAAQRVAIAICSRLMCSKCHALNKEREEGKRSDAVRLLENLPGSLSSPQCIAVINRPLACQGLSAIFSL